ncbi:MAG TPA: lipopolysaccharide kinase InaA family protein [Sedimentisphaerales bacterium]|nr:lipopolysaccharide kinase InaA family protein [Sedimentisphaerales bacterium]
MPARSACAEEVVVGRSLRVLPGTREVSEASWRGREVVLKVFHHRWKARCHYRRELRGLRRLAQLGFRAPVLLLSGRTKERHWAVVTEKIDHAATGLEVWRQADTVQQKVDLLCLIAAELARHHRKGVTQADLHIGNFMLRGDAVFSLDVAQMSFRGRPLGRRASIEDLAKLLSCLGDDKFWGIDAVANAYAKERQWQWSQADDEAVRRRVGVLRRKVVERLVRSSLRTTSRTLRFRHGRFRGVFEKELAAESPPSQFCDALDTLLREGEVLKDGNTCFVARVRWDQCDVVVKRYNHKGFWHSLRHTLKGSRARRNWLHAHRLRFLGIPTARAVAYIDEWRGPLLWQSYFVTAFIQARSLSHLMGDARADRSTKEMRSRQVLQLLERLADHRITHGDTKHSNFLLDADRAVLTDLDGMRVHRLYWTLRRRFNREVMRFAQDCDWLKDLVKAWQR